MNVASLRGMFARSTILRGPGGVAAVAMLLVACSNGAIRSQTPTYKTAALSLRTAIVPGTPTLLTCHGGAFCRENVIAPGHGDAVDEIIDDCAHRGGATSATPCPREKLVASCSVGSGEAGPIKVLTYAQDNAKDQAEAVQTMSELCESFDGAFELAADVPR